MGFKGTDTVLYHGDGDVTNWGGTRHLNFTSTWGHFAEGRYTAKLCTNQGSICASQTFDNP